MRAISSLFESLLQTCLNFKISTIVSPVISHPQHHSDMLLDSVWKSRPYLLSQSSFH